MKKRDMILVLIVSSVVALGAPSLVHAETIDGLSANQQETVSQVSVTGNDETAGNENSAGTESKESQDSQGSSDAKINAESNQAIQDSVQNEEATNSQVNVASDNKSAGTENSTGTESKESQDSQGSSDAKINAGSNQTIQDSVQTEEAADSQVNVADDNKGTGTEDSTGTEAKETQDSQGSSDAKINVESDQTAKSDGSTNSETDNSEVQPGWNNIGDHQYYYNDDLTPASGVQTVDGKKYYFYSDGQLADSAGTTTNNGKLIAWNDKGEVTEEVTIVANQWIKFQNQWYYYNEDLNCYNGVQTIDGKKYYFYGNGQLANSADTTTDSGKLIAWNDKGEVTEEATIVANKWIKFQNSWYYYDNDLNGYHGVQTINGKKYYFFWGGRLANYAYTSTDDGKFIAWNDKGEVTEEVTIVANQWIKFQNQWYYFDNDLNGYSGVQTIDGKEYYFYGNGQLANSAGITTDNGKLIAWNKNGEVTGEKDIVANQWIKFQDQWYYFDNDLNGYSDVQTIDGKEYYFYWNGQLANYSGTATDNGKLIAWNKKGEVTEEKDIVANKWIKFQDQWYYYDNDLNGYNGAQIIDGKKYYFSWNGQLANYSGTATDNGKLIAWNDKGEVIEEVTIVANKWFKFQDLWYYFDSNLNGYSGVQTINGKKYYFLGNGQLAHYADIAADNGKLIAWNKDGEVIKEKDIVANKWIKFQNQWYYFDDDLNSYSGAQIIDGKKYYFYWNGQLANSAGTATDNGKLIAWNDKGEVTEEITIAANKWIKFQDQWYYFDNDLNGYSDVQTIDGKEYYFYWNGQLANYSGTATDNGKLIAWNKKGEVTEEKDIVANKWIKFQDQWYYYDSDLAGFNGLHVINGSTYDFSNGMMLTGLQSVFDSTNNKNYTYYFDNSGHMQTGWKLLNGQTSWYLFDTDGRGHNGWSSNGKYYLSDGQMLIGDYFIDGKAYHFNTDGLVQSNTAFNDGWKEYNGRWYYLENNKLVKNAKKTINGKDYYFDDFGRMVEDSIVNPDGSDNKYYYFKPSGEMFHGGWYKKENNYIYAESDGQLVNGWKKINDIWYYFYSYIMKNKPDIIDGEYQTFSSSGKWTGKITPKDGWNTVYPYEDYDKEQTYFVDGKPVVGWKQIDNQWYYFNSNYFMVIGLCYIDGKDYLFNENGQMVKNGWSYGYYADANGIAKTGWLQSGNDWYYLSPYHVIGVEDIEGEYNIFDDNGKWIRKVSPTQNGWLQVGTNWFYFENGAPYSDWLEYNGNHYYIEYGKMITDVYHQVINDLFISNDQVTSLNNSSVVVCYIKPDGTKAKNEDVVIDGKQYHVSETGLLIIPWDSYVEKTMEV